LEGLIGLRWLLLNNTKVGDAGMVHLKGLKNLLALHLSNTQVSNAGLEQLKGIIGLNLRLDGTNVSK
jgi:hypothetical protein